MGPIDRFLDHSPCRPVKASSEERAHGCHAPSREGGRGWRLEKKQHDIAAVFDLRGGPPSTWWRSWSMMLKPINMRCGIEYGRQHAKGLNAVSVVKLYSIPYTPLPGGHRQTGFSHLMRDVLTFQALCPLTPYRNPCHGVVGMSFRRHVLSVYATTAGKRLRASVAYYSSHPCS